MRDSLKFLDGAAYVEKYSWFSYGVRRVLFFLPSVIPSDFYF